MLMTWTMEDLMISIQLFCKVDTNIHSNFCNTLVDRHIRSSMYPFKSQASDRRASQVASMLLCIFICVCLQWNRLKTTTNRSRAIYPMGWLCLWCVLVVLICFVMLVMIRTWQWTGSHSDKSYCFELFLFFNFFMRSNSRSVYFARLTAAVFLFST